MLRKTIGKSNKTRARYTSTSAPLQRKKEFIRRVQFYVAAGSAMTSCDIASCMLAKVGTHASFLDAKGYFHDKGWGATPETSYPFGPYYGA